MSFQDLSKAKPPIKSLSLVDQKEQDRRSLLINSSFNLDDQNKIPKNKEITSEVLKKVSQIIVSLHSTLVPKTQNIEIYRDLSEQQQKMLKSVQDSKLIHTILAGVLAIDSCLKYIHRQQTYIISSLMKGVSIALGNYKKIQEEFLLLNQDKISQNFLKFYDSLKLIISEIHKIPAAKIKKNQIDKHNQLITNAKMNNELTNILNRQQNLLFAFLAQENNSLRMKIKQLEKQISLMEKEKDKIIKSAHTIQSTQKKLRTSETGSQSQKTLSQQAINNQIKQLKQQVLQKNDIIIKMNDEFALQMEKYQKVFKRLEEENKLLKKYNDLDTVYILEELQFEVERLRNQKRNDQSLISQIMEKMDRMSWNYNNHNFTGEEEFRNTSTYKKYLANNNVFNQKPIFLGTNQRYQTMRRSRCPSVSPQGQQVNNLPSRFFSPNYEVQDYRERQPANNRNYYPKILQNGGFEYSKKRNHSPKFGSNNGGLNDRDLQSIKQRISVSRQRKSKVGMGQYMKNKYNEEMHEMKEMKKSQTNFSGMKAGMVAQQNFQVNKIRNRMKKSLLGEEINYLP